MTDKRPSALLIIEAVLMVTEHITDPHLRAAAQRAATTPGRVAVVPSLDDQGHMTLSVGLDLDDRTLVIGLPAEDTQRMLDNHQRDAFAALLASMDPAPDDPSELLG